ncbi:MAG: hypothetical protein KatS3mg031_1276 [Chitinophagales bacterium]|nr:MAG: hypothetical protein KatS3mg031_1276 [Chitinophagales bacterium]
MKHCCETGDVNPKRERRKRYFNYLVMGIIVAIAVAVLTEWMIIIHK